MVSLLGHGVCLGTGIVTLVIMNTVKTNALEISGKVRFLSVELIFRRQKFTVLASYLSHCKILKYQAITP